MEEIELLKKVLVGNGSKPFRMQVWYGVAELDEDNAEVWQWGASTILEGITTPASAFGDTPQEAVIALAEACHATTASLAEVTKVAEGEMKKTIAEFKKGKTPK